MTFAVPLGKTVEPIKDMILIGSLDHIHFDFIIFFLVPSKPLEMLCGNENQKPKTECPVVQDETERNVTLFWMVIKIQ
jgi:hypothetical protein